MRPLVLASALSLPLVLLTGCALTTEAVPGADVASPAIAGSVHGGQQPVASSTVKVWQVGTSGYGAGATVLATTTSSSTGVFAFTAGQYTCPHANTPVYITSQGGNSGAGTNLNLMLAAGLGPCSAAQSETVSVNEVTTAATAFALAQFFTTTLGSASTDLIGGTAAGSGVYSKGLTMANTYTIPTLVNLGTGAVNANTSLMTIESAKIYSIANTLAACVNSSGQTSNTDVTTACGVLFHNTLPPGATTRPYDTLQAAVQMALYPYQNVANLYNNGVAASPFVGLATVPNDWTVGVSYTTSTMGLGIDGTATSRTSASMDIDAGGRVWFPSSKTGAAGVGYFDPTSNSFNGPYAGTRLTHPQYLAIDQTGTVWATDLSSDNLAGVNSTSPGSVTSLTLSTASSLGPLTVDYDNTIDFSYTLASNSSLQIVTVNAARTSMVNNGYGFFHNPTGLAVSGGELFAATSGSNTACYQEGMEVTGVTSAGASSVVTQTAAGDCYSGGATLVNQTNDWLTMAATANEYCTIDTQDCLSPSVPLNAPEGVATDGNDDEWMANSGNASVSTMHGYASSPSYAVSSPIAYLHDSTHGSTMTTPYAIQVDGSGHVWVLNASCVTTSGTACTPTSTVLSELIGAAGPTIMPISLQQSTSNGGTFNQGTRPTY